MTNDKPLREQLIAARAEAKRTGVPLRDSLPELLRCQPSNVAGPILRSHGLDEPDDTLGGTLQPEGGDWRNPAK